jgi:hypothetical protein
VLFVACWNQSSVILEQVCDSFDLQCDTIRNEDRELNIADYNTFHGKRFTDLLDGEPLTIPQQSHREQKLEDEMKRYFNIQEDSDIISEMPEQEQRVLTKQEIL